MKWSWRTAETFITVAIATSRHSKNDSKRNRLTSYHHKWFFSFRCVVSISSHLLVMWSIVFHLCVCVCVCMYMIAAEHMCTANEISIYNITMSSSWLLVWRIYNKTKKGNKIKEEKIVKKTNHIQLLSGDCKCVRMCISNTSFEPMTKTDRMRMPQPKSKRVE